MADDNDRMVLVPLILLKVCVGYTDQLLTIRYAERKAALDLVGMMLGMTGTQFFDDVIWNDSRHDINGEDILDLQETVKELRELTLTEVELREKASAYLKDHPELVNEDVIVLPRQNTDTLDSE
jgi:hypothetical protein